MEKIVIGADTETQDELLKTSGYSWKYGKGKILCTALYYEADDRVEVISGLHNENNNISEEERKKSNDKIKAILQNPNVCLVGANIIYDLGFWLYEYGMSTYDVKCSFVDVLQAESILDEFGTHSLESVSRKYLNYGKTKDEIETWIQNNVSKKGDFRRYLKDAPWDLLCEYVTGDAKNPVKVWRKQLTLLKEQNLTKRVKLEFDCILPTLQMTMNGMPIDVEEKQNNLQFLQKAIDKLHKEFMEKYNLPSFRVTATRDIASFCDSRNIPYRCRITLKGYNGSRFTDGEDTDNAYNKAKKIVSQFRLVKGTPVAFVPKELAERTCSLLEEEGFMITCSANVDKNFFASQRDNYPEIALIADWKLAKGIESKILGEKYDRFLTTNIKGEVCCKPQFKITDTISFRYSSNAPNFQQIPSKGGFYINEDKKEIKVDFPKLTRALFKASKGCVFGKIDYGQIEYRLICNIACGKSGEEVREAFRKNPKLDFHQYVVDLTGLDRKHAKNMSFGISFGMSQPSMAESFGWTMERTQEIADAYHAKMPFVKPTLELIGDVAKQRGYIVTACGSHARLHDKRKAYTMLNRYTQGSGAECLKSAIVQAYKEGIWEKIKVSNVVHDEINTPYLESTEESMISFYRMAQIMREAVPTLNIPLEAEIELGDNWANTKEISKWLELRDKEDEQWINSSSELKKSVNICEILLKEGKVV